MLIKKERTYTNSGRESRILFLGLRIWLDRKTVFRRTVKLLGVTVLSYRYKKCRIAECGNVDFFEDNAAAVDYAVATVGRGERKAVLWIDHALGGGTATYSRARFDELRDKYDVVRLQYSPVRMVYVFSLPDDIGWCVPEFEEVERTVSTFKFAEICVNSIVGWPDHVRVFKLVAGLKRAVDSIRVMYCGHDFYCICPSYNLLDSNAHFCALPSEAGCDSCIEHIRAKARGGSGAEPFANFFCMREWRDGWARFFDTCVDEVVVFSHSSEKLFTRAYPVLDGKVKVLPHKTVPLRKVQIKEHDGVNIAAIGNIGNAAKGCDVLKRICEVNADCDVRLFIIGTYGSRRDAQDIPGNLVVTGRYKTDDLPELMEANKIDLVFMPSVCPETFSFTTSEAMSMGMPIACYDIGAQAERVGGYEKGLVLPRIDPKSNLLAMKMFAEKFKGATGQGGAR